MKEQFTPEELANMTEEERKGLEATLGPDEGGMPEEVIPDEVAAKQAADAAAAAQGADKPLEVKDQAVNTGVDTKGEGEKKPALEPAKANDFQPPPVFAPKFEAMPEEQVKAAQTELDSIPDKIKDLRVKLNAGDLSLDEFDEQKDALKDRQFELKQTLHENELNQKQNQQLSEQLWIHDQSVFFNQHKEYLQNPMLMKVLEGVLAQVDADAGENRLAGYEALNKAHEELTKLMGGTITAPPGKPGNGAGGDPLVKNEIPARERTDLPKTLTGLPVAEGNDTAQNEFAQLDALAEKGGVEYEKALARLTLDQEKRWLRSRETA